MNFRFLILLIILFLLKVIDLEEVAEKSVALAISITIGFIAIPIYQVFKIMKEVIDLKNENFKGKNKEETS
tara:strand:- start:13 stop:225 length:213 start_codon:yes stop_codon:yes gene_type:complete